MAPTRRKRPYWKSKTATDQNGHTRNSEVNVRNSFLFAWYTCDENWSATCAITTTNACNYKLNIKDADVRSLPIRPGQPSRLFCDGTPAAAKDRATKSLRAWCLANRPGALLQTKLWSPRASTTEPQWHWCSSHRSSPSLKPTVTLTASTSSFKPHEAMGRAKSQFSLCCVEAARKKARWCTAQQ